MWVLMGGISQERAGAYGSSPRKSKVKVEEAQYQKTLVQDLEWWMNKRNEVLGSMIEDDEFVELISKTHFIDNTAFEIDKAYLFEALENIEVLRNELDLEVMQKIFDYEASDDE